MLERTCRQRLPVYQWLSLTYIPVATHITTAGVTGQTPEVHCCWVTFVYLWVFNCKYSACHCCRDDCEWRPSIYRFIFLLSHGQIHSGAGANPRSRRRDSGTESITGQPQTLQLTSHAKDLEGTITSGKLNKYVHFNEDRRHQQWCVDGQEPCFPFLVSRARRNA